MMSTSSSNGIGTLSERSLHAELKTWMAQKGDEIEKKVDGYHIDIVRGDLLVEIQIGNFSAIKNKLTKLLEEHPVLLVFPIPRNKWIVREDKNGRKIGRRKSPKRGREENLFDELIRLPELAAEANLRVQILFTLEEEIWRDDGKGSWRRKKWSISDRRLLEVVGSKQLNGLTDYLGLLPSTLPDPFTNRQLANSAGISRHLAGKMTYCLRKMGSLDIVGKESQAFLFTPAVAVSDN